MKRRNSNLQRMILQTRLFGSPQVTRGTEDSSQNPTNARDGVKNRNPTRGSGWIIQVQPTTGAGQITLLSFLFLVFARKDNNVKAGVIPVYAGSEPPTALGAI